MARGEVIPAWMEEAGRCRGCGQVVKLCDRDTWDAL
jgi:hypothetical protein